MTDADRKVLLVILDGWGHSDFDDPPSEGNAVELAEVPTYRRLYSRHPRTRLACSGRDVGLPEGQMGNSEVGHLNLGAGRVVAQDIVRIDASIADGAFADQLGLDEIVEGLRAVGGTLHVVGLVSDGGVHSHLRHFTALLDVLPEDVRTRLHCITDGRDTSPTGGLGYLRVLADRCARVERWAIASIVGRYWAMDRDKRWDRTRRAFDLIARGRADVWADTVDVLADSYAAGTTDEFVEPTGIRGSVEKGIAAEDVVFLLNFRADRMRQLTAALSEPDFDGFEREGPLPGRVVTMTEYQERLPVTVAFPPFDVAMGLSEFLSARGLRQLKVAETEKYAHVTYFFNGGEETPWAGEDRTLIPSPKVATYDLQPEMSARGVADAVIDGIGAGYDFILVNFANPDMVGHTGVIPAAVSAVEAVDACMTDILDAVSEHPRWVALVTADHGNCEMMIDADGNVHTAHTTEPVDFIVFDPQGGRVSLLDDARLADVAPTVLAYMGLTPPDAMSGRSIVEGR
ncbi:MAG: 2,3-bisphosphoglycerate-independent phosphoglycerate mutase [Gemmatimonadota bacterium]|nr:2,3-bisphosphoglycerate-independent phosphoglycerate mutase [Gemmatimonadota bacterium]